MAETAAPLFNAYTYEKAFHDETRANTLVAAIGKLVRPGDFVAVAGMGTGIIGALTAANAGAGRVVNYELDKELAASGVENTYRNGLASKVEVLHTSALTVEPPEPINVLIADMGRTGLADTPQLDVLRNLRRFLAPGGRVIPGRSWHTAQLVNAENEIYGLDMSVDIRARKLPGDTAASSVGTYLTVDYLSGDLPTHVNSTTSVHRYGKTGVANAVRLSFGQKYAPGIKLKHNTPSLWPLTIFLAEPIVVRKGHEYEISLNYPIGALPNQIAVAVHY